MKNIFTGVFRNNGKARGWIYVLLAAFTLMTERFTQWATDPPESWWQYVATFTALIVAMLNAARAYLDGTAHEDKQKKEGDKPVEQV